jgi:N-acetyl-alpha-D-muramate 1-phosphate uridylyltransferase
MLPIAILAGGLATRLRPMTDRVPKALLSIAGQPFIFHQLRLLKNQGIDRVVLCVGHLGEQVKALVGDGRNLGLAIQYSLDGIELLGTGGALKKALPLLGDDFFVLNGDSYLPCSFARIQSAYESARRPVLMTVLRNDGRWDKSNILFKNGELIEYDKKSRRFDMSHIDYGLSVLSKHVFSPYRESTAIDLADICRDLSKAGKVAAFEVSGRFYEIGSPEGIRDTEEFLAHQELPSRRSINE